MKEIIYLKGDATSPQASGVKIVAHVSNDIGKWEKIEPLIRETLLAKDIDVYVYDFD